MCRAASTSLDPAPNAAGLARRYVQAALDRWEISDSRDSALLLTSELVTNATVHAHARVGLSVAVGQAALEVVVADEMPRLPRPRYQAGQTPPRAQPQWLAGLAEGGRGLMIVEALADEWGIAEERAGKRVWFRLDIDESWPHNTSCPCHGGDLHDAVALPSGRRVCHVSGPWDRGLGV